MNNQQHDTQKKSKIVLLRWVFVLLFYFFTWLNIFIIFFFFFVFLPSFFLAIKEECRSNWESLKKHYSMLLWFFFLSVDIHIQYLNWYRKGRCTNTLIKTLPLLDIIIILWVYIWNETTFFFLLFSSFSFPLIIRLPSSIIPD
jgi:hypothetical protein